MTGPIALVRRPSPQLTDGLVTHVERRPVDLDRALVQWQAYVDVLAAEGWRIVEVPPADHCPDGVFIEDALVVYGTTAVVTRPGDDRRKPEIVEVEPAIAALGYDVHRIESPGTLDGGDVLKVGETVYVGLGDRTNAEGIEQLRAILAPLGASVIAVPLSAVLHLKSAVTALPDGTVVGWPPVVDDSSVFATYLAVAEEPGAHVVVLGDDRVLMSHDAPESAAMFRARGLQVVTVDIGEFVKLEGCVTCLSVRLRTPPA